MMKNRWMRGLMTLMAVMLLSINANAASVLVSDFSPAVYGYGHAQWSYFNAALDAATGGQVTTTPTFHDIDQMMAHDAIFLNLRSGTLLDSTEIDNITAFIATGRKVVLMGENHYSADWNNQILGIVGGSFVPGSYLGPPVPPAVINELTLGVGDVTLSSSGVAAGGLPLFIVNWATLWGDNVLTMLDGNVFDEYRWENDPDNALFGENVAHWIADSNPVPIPGAVWLFGTGLAALVGLRRRMR